MVERIDIPEATEAAACPVCGGSGGITVGTRGRFGMAVRNLCCARCATIYITPRPTADAMARYYEGAYRQHYKSVGVLLGDGSFVAPGDARARDLTRRTHELQAQCARKLANTQPGARVLEIGCKGGETLALLRAQLGIDAHGIEPGAREAARATQAGITCFAGPLERYDPGDLRFDQAQMFHVLEHLHEPLAALLKIRSWLKPGGALLVEVPNAYQPYGLLEANFFQNVHLTTFSPSTLPALLRRAGFGRLEVIDATTLFVVGRKGEEAGEFPLPFGRGLLANPDHDAAWVAARLRTYAKLERIRFAVRQGGMTRELLTALLPALSMPAFAEHLLDTCAEIVERLIEQRSYAEALSILEKLCEGPFDDAVRAQMRNMAERVKDSLNAVARRAHG